MVSARPESKTLTAYEFLNQGRNIEKTIKRKEEEIAQFRAKINRATAQLTGMPRGGKGSDWTDIDVKVLEYEKEVRKEIERLCEVRLQIIHAIAEVKDRRYRELLEMRYRNGYKFEKIAVEMNYDWRHVMKLHREALDVIKVPEQKMP